MKHITNINFYLLFMSKNKVFFNTNGTPDDQLPLEEAKATKQDLLVLSIFQKAPDSHFTSSQIEKSLRIYPRSSITRAINTLTKRGLLLKTNVRAMGDYGKMCFTWKLNKS